MKQPASFLGLLAVGMALLGGCGGPDSDAVVGNDRPDRHEAVRNPGVPQPHDGVPPGTSPLPLPEPGQAYNNPQPRSNVRDGGALTLPIGELGPNFNLFSVDGNSADLANILNWTSPRLWDVSVTGEPSPNEDFLISAELLSENPEVVKYTLNPNAKWNDGTPIDWTAFDATWKTQRGDDPRYNPASTDGYRSIESVRKGTQPNEVIVTFKEPFYPFEVNVFDKLEHPKSSDADFYRTGWVNVIHADLLAGPFTVESLTPEQLVLVRNPRWWGDPPKLERVVYRQMDDIATVNAFQNGEVDTTTINGTRATADVVEQIKNMEGVQLRRGFTTATSVYLLGQDADFFKDVAARKAFVLATDRELLVQIRFEGLDWQEPLPGSGLLYTWQRGYRNNIADLRYSREEAKVLLDSAGWALGSDGYRHKDGKTAEFTYVSFGDDPVFTAMARAQQKMAQDVGLKMNIDVRKSSDFSPTLTAGSFDVLAMSWVADGPFGHAYACQIYCWHSESNYARVGNEHIDSLLVAVGRYRDLDEGLDAFNTAESEALHLFGLFPIYNGPAQYAVKKGLANFGPAGFLIPDAEDIGWQR